MMTINELLNLIEESKDWGDLKRKIREHRDNELNPTLSEDTHHQTVVQWLRKTTSP